MSLGSNNLTSVPVEGSFPAGALVPKCETGVLNFLQKYPEFDGRDVTIAIFDSGVDPRATGLQTLCDGKTVKVIERYDCTGAGDVDMSKTVTADADGFITGLSGRKLKLTPQMISSNNADGQFRVGLKSLHGLYPSKVRENQVNSLKLKTWDAPNKVAIADVSRKIAEFESQNSETAKLPWDKKLIKDDMDNILDMLNNYDKMYMDIKTAYDCVLYPTTNGWQAVVDITEKGDLENAVHIGEYSKTYELKNIDEYISISINVHDEGNVLEIVGMCSSHGTHVASIASGNHGNKDTDGVAPNAKIVSLTIGDGRLGSMETGTGLVRAMMKVMELCRKGPKIDVINMSYGEHSMWSNSGRIGELMNEVVNKYGVVWVASAGNHGPALCTVGTPPDISQPSCIGVGAYVSPQMMEAEYAMREKLPANVYTWTSRDPCIDGGQGVTICAPGGAITSVPQFTMCKSQLMNGTSMAAPHAAGAIALLISALKQKGIEYSPYSIKRALCATANKLSYVDPFAQGSGLLNVEKAFEHLQQYAKAPENMLRFSVRCGVSNGKGIHIRQEVLKKPMEFNVTVEPVFFNDKEAAKEDKFNFNVRLNLVCSQAFVQCGSFLDMSYTPRSLVVKVDPTGLAPGVHTAVIQAYDSDCIARGSLFEIPVTVVQPHTLNCEEKTVYEPTYVNGTGIEFQPNTIQRDFILVPNNATWAVLKMRSTDQNRNKDIGKFFVHTVQLLPQASCRIMEAMKILNVTSEHDATMAIQVQPNNILELCIAKYWSNYGSSHVKYSLEFRGVNAIDTNGFTFHAARGIHRVDLLSLGIEEIQPTIGLKTAVVALKPIESKITPLSSTRDVIPEGRQIYQNVLTYTLNVTKANEVAIHAPLFNSILYESEFESQLWMIFDCNKSMVACGDAHSHKFYSKLEKGEYTIKLQIRHEKRDMLEKISEATVLAYFKLANPLAMDFYDHYNQCIVSGKKYTTGLLKPGVRKPLYLGPIPQEKLSKANLPANCSFLSGTLTLPRDELGRKVDFQECHYILNTTENGKKNGNGGGAASGNTAAANVSATSSSTVLKAKSSTGTIPPAGDGGSQGQASNGATNTAGAAAAANGNSSSPKKNKTTAEEYLESLRDFQCSMITKCELEKAEKIYEEVIAAHPKHLLAHLLLIQNLESSELKAQFPLAFVQSVKKGNDNCKADEQKADPVKTRNALERIVQLADLIINNTEKDTLLAYYGLKNDTRPDASKIKTNMDKQKANLLEAYAKKGIAMAKLAVLDNKLSESVADLDSIYTDIIKFADANDAKVINFTIWHAFAHEHYGRMVKSLQKLYEDKRNRENLEELALVAAALKYNHLQTVIERLAVSANPQSYRLF